MAPPKSDDPARYFGLRVKDSKLEVWARVGALLGVSGRQAMQHFLETEVDQILRRVAEDQAQAEDTPEE
jgi:hypothetical protein